MDVDEVWGRARVLAAAPDDASRRAAQPLVATRLWTDSGRSASADGELLWGRCSGSATYAVVVAPGRAYACTCPSRKSPCKHALALLLRWADGLVPAGEAPAWAVAAQPRPREAADPDREPDADAARARAAERRAKVDAGLDELDRWLHDQVRTGLATWERRPWSQVETIAARMVDAQAPGVAGTLRGLPGILARADPVAWPERLLDALAGLHLLVEAHRALDRLPDDLAATVRSRVGYPVAKAGVLAGPAVVDHWWALAAVDSVEGRLETRRVWLWGTATRRWAMLLSFAVPGAGLDESVVVGDVLHAAVHPYPGAGEHRALIGEQWPVGSPTLQVDGVGLAQARRRWAAQVALDPWSSRMPVVVRAVPVPPARPGGAWHLADPDGTAVRLNPSVAEPWPLLAASGGDAVEVVGEWGPGGFGALRLLDRGLDAPRLLAVA